MAQSIFVSCIVHYLPFVIENNLLNQSSETGVPLRREPVPELSIQDATDPGVNRERLQVSHGSTVANMDAVGMYVMQGVNINSFWSMEPLLGPVDMAAAEGLPEWVILGAETGNRPDKVTPARKWVDDIVAFCAENEIPVFFKNNLRKYFPDLPASAFPWEV